MNKTILPESREFILVLIFCWGFFTLEHAKAQQFNSDSWISKPAGMATMIVTYGERNSMLMSTFSLLPRWEFTAAAYLYNNDNDATTDDGYSTSLFAKYMFYENKARTGGFAVKFGTGLDPGYLDGDDRVKDAFQTYWTNAPVTIPFFNNKLSWDIMPGASVTRDFGEEESTAWAFTYSTRLAWNPYSPKMAIVGEIYGSEGEIGNIPEYRIGLRWEPNPYVNLAVTYDDEFNGSNGAGFEIGLMVFPPSFFCLKGCKDEIIKKKKKDK
ncbi:MAG TPA: hypothetical protein PK228_17080 [Saprospiraceae bacterium]|nr:hypothetical protein [Saprospiraceae bacterium]